MSNPTESTPLTQGDKSSSGRGVNDIFFHPFSTAALSLLPSKKASVRAKSKRADDIPDSEDRPLVRDYHSINDPALVVRIPKKVATPVNVETKVWFANERTFVAYVSMGVLLSSMATALRFGARDSPARWFAITYGIISVGILIYGWAVFQRRLTMISTRDPGSFDLLWGPLFICAALFVAILANFLLRFADAKKTSGVNPLHLMAVWREVGMKI